MANHIIPASDQDERPKSVHEQLAEDTRFWFRESANRYVSMGVLLDDDETFNDALRFLEMRVEVSPDGDSFTYDIDSHMRVDVSPSGNIAGVDLGGGLFADGNVEAEDSCRQIERYLRWRSRNYRMCEPYVEGGTIHVRSRMPLRLESDDRMGLGSKVAEYLHLQTGVVLELMDEVATFMAGRKFWDIER